MAEDPIEKLRREIRLHKSNERFLQMGYEPLFSGSPTAKIVIIGQAPGIKAQTDGKPWSDASGDRLMKWLGVSESEFRDATRIAHMPMDFYYPGKGTSGDLPPRKDFAALWHEKILACMPRVELIILIGQYAQAHYLRGMKRPTLTETVRDFETYLPRYFPLVHPSPLNFRWFKKNEWFEQEVVPQLQARVKEMLR